MFDNQSLIERMLSVSPGARLQYTGELWKQHINEDDVTQQQLVQECFSVIIDEAYELGLEFFCTRADLSDSLYLLDKVLLFFEVVFPAPLYRSITEDAAFKRLVTAIVVDGAGDAQQTTAMNILHYLAVENPETVSIFTETFDFLQDKMRSTPVFDAYVTTILESDNTPFSVPVDDSTTTAYLSHVSTKVARLMRAIDIVRLAEFTTPDSIQLQYNRLDIYKVNATAMDAVPRYAWVYAMIQCDDPKTPLEQSLMVKFSAEFDTITPFFEEYFRMRGSPLGLEDCLSLVFGCLDDAPTKEAFTAHVDAAFDRLRSLDQPPQLELMVLVQRTTLALVREFYP